MSTRGEGQVEKKSSWWLRRGWAFPVGLVLAGGAGFLVDVVWPAAGVDRALRVDAARTTFTILIGLGGSVTLALLVHRQALAARTHDHQVADRSGASSRPSGSLPTTSPVPATPPRPPSATR
ncbi:hypothetical protein Afil01_44160 [Actinorhabdospora filicis]|uniref:Uncharacterized protein n=1 Tax=Actinorhabdospora filicis TaxID=1785913 RepID=A0A9W6WAF6_9ACTN|nr:hypothetical protein [Actinorhabdospora filicis]GLZ79609.1 hypothetical protein Afil01_44160 [Actinorhabdospora filicis]